MTIAKKPSPDCSRLLVETPSIEMLIVLCGRPLIVDARPVPGVSTPGRNVTKFIALRVTTGRFEMVSMLTVELTVVVVVGTSSRRGLDVHRLGELCRLRAPRAGSRRTPARSRTSVCTNVLNPESVTVTV